MWIVDVLADIVTAKAASMKSKVRLKLFQYIQRLCQSMGFLTSQPNPRRIFHSKILLYLLPSIVFLIPSLMFLVNVADTMQEYELSILVITSVILCITCILAMISNMQKILNVIGKFEEIIEKSVL